MTKENGKLRVEMTKENGKLRCSMQLLIEQVRGLKFTSNQLKALEKTPFWHIIDKIRGHDVVEKHCVKNDSIINTIVKCYVKREKCFRFAERKMKLTPMDAKLIFGINDGEKEIKISSFKLERSDFLQRCFPEIFSKESDKIRDKIRLRPKLICDRIKHMIESPQPEHANCVASLTTLLVLATFLVTSKSSYISWAYTTLVSDLNIISTYNWSKHVDLLLDSLERTKDGCVGRCVLLLPYWLCERSQIVQPIHKQYIPRFVKWNLSALSKTLNASNFTSMVKNQNFINVLKTTRKENELLGTTRNEPEVHSEVVERETEGGLFIDEKNLIEIPVDGIIKDDYIAFCFAQRKLREETEGVIETQARKETEGAIELIKRKKVEKEQQIKRKSQRIMDDMWKSKCKETNGMTIEID